MRKIAIDILQWNLFQMHRTLTKHDFEQCLKIGRDLPERFTSNLQAEIERLPDIGQFQTEDKFISSLCEVDGFPLTEEEFKSWLNYPRRLVTEEQISSDNIQDLCQSIYDSHHTFSLQLEPFISGGAN